MELVAAAAAPADPWAHTGLLLAGAVNGLYWTLVTGAPEGLVVAEGIFELTAERVEERPGLKPIPAVFMFTDDR